MEVSAGTMPAAEVACMFSQHGSVRAVLWGLPFPVSQRSLERCAGNFIMLAVLLLACSSLPWLSASDFLLHIDVPSFDWLVLRAGAA